MINITRSQLKADIANGLKGPQLLIKYSTPDVIMTAGELAKILKSVGLKISKSRAPRFALIDDVPVNVENPSETTIEFVNQ